MPPLQDEGIGADSLSVKRILTSEWRSIIGAAAVFLLLSITFLGSRQVPILALVDLGFHELGHLIAVPFGQTIHFLAGSVTQVAVPLGLAAYFWFRQRNLFAVGLMLAWSATSLRDVSVYIADAPYQQLPLIGGEHDWAYLLGPRGWDVMHLSEPLSGLVWFVGLIVGLFGIALCGAPALGRWSQERVERKRRGRVGRAVVREVRYRPSPDDYLDERK